MSTDPWRYKIWSLLWLHSASNGELPSEFSGRLPALSYRDAELKVAELRQTLRPGHKVKSIRHLPDAHQGRKLQVGEWHMHCATYQHQGDTCTLYLYARNMAHLNRIVGDIRRTALLGDVIIDTIYPDDNG